jgi:hypothetical protein
MHMKCYRNQHQNQKAYLEKRNRKRRNRRKCRKSVREIVKTEESKNIGKLMKQCLDHENKGHRN